MRLASLFTLALATNIAVGSSTWFSKAGTCVTNYPASTIYYLSILYLLPYVDLISGSLQQVARE